MAGVRGCKYTCVCVFMMSLSLFSVDTSVFRILEGSINTEDATYVHFKCS